MIASFTALNTQNPRRNKIYSHLFSIIPGKEPAKEHETKFENEIAVTAESSPSCGQPLDTSFWFKCRKLRCHDFSALAD